MVSTTMKESQPIRFTKEAEFLRVNVSMSDKVKKTKTKKKRQKGQRGCMWSGRQPDEECSLGLLLGILLYQELKHHPGSDGCGALCEVLMHISYS